MARILLLGAGFSRNWNGWLADEIRAKLLARLADEPELHHIVSRTTSFEEALASVQREFRHRGNAQSKANLEGMQTAIMTTFRTMNESFASRRSLEFSHERHFSIVDFLNRFDAIFTLNQDLLLELHYGNLELAEPRRWNGPSYPGMNVPAGWHNATGPFLKDRLDMIWRPGEPHHEDRSQPIYKLHGSVNWKEGDTELLVLGANKADAIAGTRLLKWYGEEFRRYLESGDARLMVIGYSFRDEHINAALYDAYRNRGLRMYLVGPSGRRVLNKQPPDALIRVHEPLEEIPIVGESVRPLSSTFNGDDLEHGDLLGFFR